MYHRSERPFTDAERRSLGRRLGDLGRPDLHLATDVPLAAVYAALGVAFAWAAATGRDKSGPVGTCCGGVAYLLLGGLVAGWLVSSAEKARERRRLRAALADGTAVEEVVAARAAAAVSVGPDTWVLCEVRPDWLYALPDDHAPWRRGVIEWDFPETGRRLRACVRRVTSGGVEVEAAGLG